MTSSVYGGEFSVNKGNLKGIESVNILIEYPTIIIIDGSTPLFKSETLKNDILKKVKLTLLANKVKYDKQSKYNLYVTTNIFTEKSGCIYHFRINLFKYGHEGSKLIRKEYGHNIGIGSSKRSNKALLDHIKDEIETFCLEYLEQNLDEPIKKKEEKPIKAKAKD
jgi:hypothetical protein